METQLEITSRILPLRLPCLYFHPNVYQSIGVSKKPKLTSNDCVKNTDVKAVCNITPFTQDVLGPTMDFDVLCFVLFDEK